MFLPLDDPAWAPCDCSTSFIPNQGPNLLIAADMFALGHNGGYEFYQVPYGGYAGATMDALPYMPPNTTFLAWWHLDSQRNVTDLVGQEMAAGIVEELAMYDFDSIGGPAWDTDTQRMWGAYAAAGERTSNAAVKGVAHYGWGTDTEGAEYMAQTGQYAWQPEWQFLWHWALSSDSWNPGGVDTSEWTTTGMVLVDDDVVRPAAGQALKVTSGSATWSAFPFGMIPMDPAQLAPTWTPTGPNWRVSWEPSAQLLLRFYTKDMEESCQIDVDYFVDSDHALVSSTVSVTATAGATPLPGAWADYRAVSARAPLPALDLTTQDLVGLKVGVDVTLTGCQDTFVDSVALYQGLSFIDFPFAYSEKNIQNDWTSSNGNDARALMCGGTSDCFNSATFDAR